jgi:Saxitoxin biosynthesis operon protein SxtJ
MRDKYFGSLEILHRAAARKTASDRSFGLTLAGFLALVGGLGLWRQSERWPLWAGLAVVALALALLAPKLLAPANRVWTKFGLLLHAVVSPLILGLIFYLCIVPIGFLMRLSGKDPLRLRYEPRSDSYWIKRSPPGPQPESFKQQF